MKKNNYKEILNNRLLIEVIDRIISSFPLTYINLERIRKDVDRFDELFWLLNNEGKYLLVNKKFAANLNLTPAQIEGQPAENFIPAYLIRFNKALDEYIRESGSVFIIEGFPFSAAPSGENYQTIEIPISGSGGKENVVIGITQKLIYEEETKVSKAGSAEDSVYDIYLQNSPDPVFIYDKENLKFLEVNNAAQTFYGYRKDEFLQLDLTDLYSPDDIQTLLQVSEEKFKEGIYSKPHRQKRRDGKVIFAEINRKSVKYKNTSAYLNIVRDVTDKLNLERESQLFDSFFENTNNLIFITDKEGFIQKTNYAVTEKLGYSSKSLKETSFTALLKDEDRGKINMLVFQSSSNEKQIFSTTLKKAGNEFLETSLSADPVFNYRGEIEGYNLICSVTEEKIKEVVKEVIKEVPVEINYSEGLASKPDAVFMSGIFHDLMTPVNVILGFVRELTDNLKQPTGEQKEIISLIEQNRKNLLGEMDQVAEFIELEKGTEELDYNKVKLVDIIVDLEKDISSNKIIGNVELAFGKISSSLEIITDRQKFFRLLELLVKITYKSTGLSKIYISSSFDEGEFGIAFRDAYGSCSGEFMQKMNSLFSAGSRRSSKEHGISFITFSLFESLLKKLKGEFIITDNNEKGEPVFMFPADLKSAELKIEDEKIAEEEIADEGKTDVVLTEPEPVAEEKTTEEFTEVYTESPAEFDLSQLSCLYFEDQVDSQVLFSMQMKDLKEIYYAAGFEDALPVLRSSKIDFLVVDINLSGDYNGIDIMKIVRSMPGYENIPVIAVSAYVLPGDKNMYLKAGFSDFISKPVLKEKLLDSLENIFIAHT